MDYARFAHREASGIARSPATAVRRRQVDHELERVDDRRAGHLGAPARQRAVRRVGRGGDAPAARAEHRSGPRVSLQHRRPGAPGCIARRHGVPVARLAVLHEIDGDAFWPSSGGVAKTLPEGAAVAEALRSGAHDDTCPPRARCWSSPPSPGAADGLEPYRDIADALAAHLRQAMAIDASDQSTAAAILYELERAPLPSARRFWPTATSRRRSPGSSGQGSRSS